MSLDSINAACSHAKKYLLLALGLIYAFLVLIWLLSAVPVWYLMNRKPATDDERRQYRIASRITRGIAKFLVLWLLLTPVLIAIFFKEDVLDRLFRK